MLLADVLCHVGVIWLMFFANVADGIATCYFIVVDEKPDFEMIDDIF